MADLIYDYTLMNGPEIQEQGEIVCPEPLTIGESRVFGEKTWCVVTIDPPLSKGAHGHAVFEPEPL